jgi:ribosomal protein S18 acetylase RimI-like enzyme
MIRVRDGEKGDAPRLADLVTELGYPVKAGELWSRIEKMPVDFHRTLVAIVSEELVGFIGLLTLPVYEHSQPIGWVLSLSVSPRRRRQGVGSALLEASEKFYRERGVTDLRLHSGLQRTEAHEFYEKMGFNRSGYRFRKNL